MTAPVIPAPTLHDLAGVPTHELRAMLARCSHRTLHTRFHSCGSSADRLADILALTGSLAGLAARVGATIVGVGSVEAPAPYELAILVEDRWQHRGIGSQLLTALATTATALGAAALTGSLTVDNTAARRLVLSRCPSARFSPPYAGVVDTVLPLHATTPRPYAPAGI